jgi:hypothetical protein
VVDETDHVEAVGHDESLGEVELDDGAIDGGQVHADDTDLVFALQGYEIGLQRGFRTPQSDVVDAMILQIAEGGGVALLPGEEVFVDAQDLGTNRRMILSRVLLQPAQELAFHSGRADAFSPAKATPVDAVQVPLIDHLLEALAGPLKGLNTRQLLAKGTAAVEARSLANLEFQYAPAKAPVVMTDGSTAPALVS